MKNLEQSDKKIYCISAAVITAFLMAVSVFVANVSHTEYKSQMRKRKVKKAQVLKTTNEIVIDKTVDNVPLTDLTTTPINV